MQLWWNIGWNLSLWTKELRLPSLGHSYRLSGQVTIAVNYIDLDSDNDIVKSLDWQCSNVCNAQLAYNRFLCCMYSRMQTKRPQMPSEVVLVDRLLSHLIWQRIPCQTCCHRESKCIACHSERLSGIDEISIVFAFCRVWSKIVPRQKLLYLVNDLILLQLLCRIALYAVLILKVRQMMHIQILTQEDWNEVLYNGMSKTSAWAALYFIYLMTFGNYVLFNLLVAILVEGFSSDVSLL